MAAGARLAPHHGSGAPLSFCSFYAAIQFSKVYMPGRSGLLVAFLLAASILALQRGRLLLAGILMALTTIKPQVSVLAIFYLVLWSLWDWRKRGRYCVGFFSTLLLLFATSLAVWPHWIQSWTHALVAYHRYTTPVLVSEVLTSHLPPGAVGPATLILTAGLMIVAVVIAWRNSSASPDSHEFSTTLSLLLAITVITLLPGQAVYDHVILLPGVLLLARRWRDVFFQPNSESAARDRDCNSPLAVARFSDRDSAAAAAH